MKEQFLAGDSDHFADHVLLEMLLYYSTPRRDTNELAHTLIDRFGSLEHVMEASPDELMYLDGVKRHTATLIKLCSAISRRCATNEIDPDACYDTLGKVGDLLIRKYMGIGVERVYVLLFDNALRLIECAAVADGTVNSSNVPIRTIIEKAILKRASALVIVHNHPSGLAIPSGEDIEMTHVLDQACSMMGVNLMEHVLVAGTKYAPLLKKQRGVFRCSPISGEIAPEFYQRYYGEKEANTRV